MPSTDQFPTTINAAVGELLVTRKIHAVPRSSSWVAIFVSPGRDGHQGISGFERQ